MKKRQQRDPGDVRQDHVHRRDSGVPGRCGSRDRHRRRSLPPRSGTGTPARASAGRDSISRGMICGSTTRIATCQVDAPSVCALIICSRGRFCDRKRQVADQERRDADDDQHHLRQFAEPEYDEQDRQDGHRRNHRDHRDDRAEATRPRSAAVRASARRPSPIRVEIPKSQQQPLQARRGVGPQHVFSRPPVGLAWPAASWSPPFR